MVQLFIVFGARTAWFWFFNLTNEALRRTPNSRPREQRKSESLLKRERNLLFHRNSNDAISSFTLHVFYSALTHLCSLCPSHCLSSLCVYFLFLVEGHITQKLSRKNKVQNVMRLHQHKVKSFSVMSF